MLNIINREYFGKRDISSHFSRCESCHHLTLLSSYSTTRFVKIMNVYFLPVGRFRMIDECSHCGFRGTVTLRKYVRERERNLALMMDGFASEADNPGNCAHALHTLMVYDQHTWFHDVQKSYGLRFERQMDIQLLLAQGLCRFGDYKEAISYCRKAIVLGAGKPGEELLAFCQDLTEAIEAGRNPEQMAVQPESSLKAYLPISSVAAALAVSVISLGISSMRNYRAWIVNGSLSEYSFTLDNESYTLGPGTTKQITLRLGEHDLKFGSTEEIRFTYAIPMIKQLMEKHTLVINPDATALFAVSTDRDGTTEYYHGKQILILSGLTSSLDGISRKDEWDTGKTPLVFYRPATHLAMVNLMMEHLNQRAAEAYAKRVLKMNPATPEASSLLRTVTREGDDKDIRAFLQTGLTVSPTLLPWHLEYQNYMMIHHPEYNLEHDYTLRCKDLPDEAESYYLLGRVVHNREAACKFFEYSETLPRMEGEGYQAIARSLFVRGQFNDALPYSNQAVACNTTNAVFLDLNEQLHMALRQYDELIEHRQSSRSDLSRHEQSRRTILYLTCAGYHREAEAEAVRLGNQDDARLPELNAIRYYAVGNIADYLSCIEEAGTGEAQMVQLLHNNRIEDAELLISQNEQHAYREHLVLYCAAMHQGFLEISNTNFQKAAAEAGHDTLGRHQISMLLADHAMPTLDAIQNLDIDAQEKAVLCVALGYRFPELRMPLFTLAEKYNFNRTYPQLLLKKWIRAASSKPARPHEPSTREALEPAA